MRVPHLVMLAPALPRSFISRALVALGAHGTLPCLRVQLHGGPRAALCVRAACTWRIGRPSHAPGLLPPRLGEGRTAGAPPTQSTKRQATAESGCGPCPVARSDLQMPSQNAGQVGRGQEHCRPCPWTSEPSGDVWVPSWGASHLIDPGADSSVIRELRDPGAPPVGPHYTPSAGLV